MSVSVEDLEWLRCNWTPGEPTFRRWVAGSNRAHQIVLGLLERGPDADSRRGARLILEDELTTLVRAHPLEPTVDEEDVELQDSPWCPGCGAVRPCVIARLIAQGELLEK